MVKAIAPMNKIIPPVHDLLVGGQTPGRPPLLCDD
jgi:hypothetical protein